MVKKHLNRKMKIEEILLTMVDFRTNYAKDISKKVRDAYGVSIARTCFAIGARLKGHFVDC